MELIDELLENARNNRDKEKLEKKLESLRSHYKMGIITREEYLEFTSELLKNLYCLTSK